jgi:hypothetical protein
VLSRLKIAVRINLLLALAAFGMLLNAGLELWVMRTHMLEDKRAHLADLMDLVLNDARGHMNRSGGAANGVRLVCLFPNDQKREIWRQPDELFFRLRL